MNCSHFVSYTKFSNKFCNFTFRIHHKWINMLPQIFLALWFNLLQVLNILFHFLLIQFFLLLVYYHTDNIKMKDCSCHSMLKIFQLLSIWFSLIYILCFLSDFSAHPVIFSCPVTVVFMTFLIISKLFFSKVNLQWFFSLLSTLVLIFF